MCTGMRNKEDGKKHGIVRIVWPSSDIWEASYKHGKEHGLTVKYEEK